MPTTPFQGAERLAISIRHLLWPARNNTIGIGRGALAFKPYLRLQQCLPMVLETVPLVDRTRCENDT